jgi:hypothetical protein
MHNRHNVPPNYDKYLESLLVPIMMQKQYPNISNSVEYPLESVVNFWGPKLNPNADGNYFASSFSYMFMFAVMEGYNEIHCYGFDMLDGSEYAHQRPNAEYLIGVARGMGIHVHLPSQSALCKHNRRYGYDDVELEGPITVKSQNERIKHYEEETDKALKRYMQLSGCLEEAREMKKQIVMYMRGGSYHRKE